MKVVDRRETRMLTKSQFFVLGAVLLQIGEPIYAARILGYLLSPSQSHFVIHDALMRGLAAKGHNITVLSIFPGPKDPIPNYRFFQLEPNAKDADAFTKEKKEMLKTANDNVRLIFNWSGRKAMHRISVNLLRHPVLEQLKREENYDLVVFGWHINDYQLGIAAHFQCRSVIISATPAFKPLRDYVGNPSGMAYTEFMFYQVGNRPMTFKERVITHIWYGLEAVIFDVLDWYVHEPNYVEHFPADRYPSFAEAKKNVSLVMVSSHFSQGIPMATFPGLIEISGIQIKKEANPLPADIKTFMDDAEDGVILMSFGSNINSAHMTAEKREAMLKVFGKIKQRVLWKWEDDQLPGKPDNVMIGNWLPQNDILAHPNVRLFISHCGKGSVNEARSNGVPILGIPMFAEQPANADTIVKEGWALKQVYGDLTEKSLAANLNEILTNPKYREVVKSSADLYKDRPAHPLDTAVYWVEYVLRHKGAKHMQSQAIFLNWFQAQSLDVIAFLLAVLYVSWKLFQFIVRLVWRKCFCSYKQKFINNSKKQK